MDGKRPVLYISYDGLLEPLGRSQIVPYICGLARGGKSFAVLSFEKRADLLDARQLQELADLLQREGIEWKRLPYHKRPPVLSTFYDILAGSICAFRYIKRRGCFIVHVRSYVPAMIALILRRAAGVEFVFDMRGFWADERVEAKIWKRDGRLYRATKYFERIFLREAKATITLTNAAREEIVKNFPSRRRDGYIDFIPTCVDLDRFRLGSGAASSGPVGMTAVYSGSASTWYLPEKVIEFFEKLRSSVTDAALIVCTREQEIFRKIAQAKGLAERSVTIKEVRYDEMPLQLQNAQAGIAFYKQGYSRMACCPTKIGEYLACGLVVIVTKGVGDTERILTGEHVGVVIDDFSDEGYARAVDAVRALVAEPDIRKRCRAAAEKYFSIEHGIARYRKMYTEAFS